MYAEIIYETGNKSVACYEDEAELLSAVKAHHERAKTGQPALSSVPGVPAERILKVEIYDKHPNDLNLDQTLSAEVAKAEIDKWLKDKSEEGVVSVTDLTLFTRDLSSPLTAVNEPHKSMYKMESVKTLESKEWDS